MEVMEVDDWFLVPQGDHRMSECINGACRRNIDKHLCLL